MTEYKLEQIRECDGACCRHSPRFPVDDNPRMCQFLDITTETVQVGSGAFCTIMSGEKSVPQDCSIFPDKDGPTTYKETCVDYPQNTKPGRNLANCCWQWIEV